MKKKEKKRKRDKKREKERKGEEKRGKERKRISFSREKDREKR